MLAPECADAAGRGPRHADHSADPESAPDPTSLREKAFFVLANSNTPEAQNAIGQIARGQSNPQLQMKAIRMYAAIKGKQSVAMLSDVYQHSSDEAVKRAILQSYLSLPDRRRSCWRPHAENRILIW